MVVDISIEDTRLKGKRPGLSKNLPADGDSGFIIPCLGRGDARTMVLSSLVSSQSLVGKAEAVVWDVVHG